MKALLAAALMTALATASGATTAHAEPSQELQRVLVQNKYYPKPGMEQAVLETRLEASEVRRRLGLEVGTVFVRVGEVDGPHVVWECEYPSIEARIADAAAAEGASEFAAIQARMRGLVENFERLTWQQHD